MRVGIIGGGQLGMMLAEELRAMGASTICLDPSVDAPAFAVCDESVVGKFDDMESLDTLCKGCDVVTYEFENIPADTLVELEKRYNIKQGIKQLFDSQDRLREKNLARDLGLATPRYIAANTEQQLQAAVEELGVPCVVKTRRLGYDGHGQAVVRKVEDLAKAKALLATECIVEEFMTFDFETSVVMVGDQNGVVTFPMGRNIHRDGILDLCVVPLSGELMERIKEQSRVFMTKAGYRGILTIEYFVKDGELYFNEMAPRPHNSGHYTIEGCTTSQFRELARYLVGEKLQEPELVAPTIMKNILGEDLVAAEQLAANPPKGCYVHLYGKSESKPKRKMGHITFVDMSLEQYKSQYEAMFVKGEC